LDVPKSIVEDHLENHLTGLFGFGAASSQVEAWLEEIEVLKNAFRNLAISRPDSLMWSVILEYELPLEGGRRPDVIVLGPEILFVLEFKQDPHIHRSSLDQVAAYARDLAEYHSKTHGLEVLPILIPTKLSSTSELRDLVTIISPDLIASHLDQFHVKAIINLEDWLEGDYAPLPTLISAARMIFNHERLPAIKRAESLGVAKAVSRLREISEKAKAENFRALAFVSGVPGAGKTLVGLQFVYDESDQNAQAVFLSGNGPLVEVLRDALKSKAFVSDLHAFIKSYGTTSKVPKQHIIVFDEAQRAWDATHMMNKKSVAYSEPELLISIGERIDGWTALVGLIGHGQEINTGEEAGIRGWSEALKSEHATSDWKVFSPPRFSRDFDSLDVTEYEELDLTRTLRSKQAENLHEWVQTLLTGQISDASRIAQKIWLQNFPIFVTRDLEAAKEYVRNRFSGEEKRFGILASSKDRVLPEYGILNGFQDTKLVKYAAWYNKSIGEKGSSCNFQEVVTEFGCQGLELDMAIVAWGNDFLWNSTAWQMRKIRSRFLQHDPHQLRLNSYRVLLTRSREGIVIFIPPTEEFNSTEHVLLAAGARILTEEIPLTEVS